MTKMAILEQWWVDSATLEKLTSGWQLWKKRAVCDGLRTGKMSEIRWLFLAEKLWEYSDFMGFSWDHRMALKGPQRPSSSKPPTKKTTTKQTKENLLVDFAILTALVGFIHVQENLITNPKF